MEAVEVMVQLGSCIQSYFPCLMDHFPLAVLRKREAGLKLGSSRITRDELSVKETE